MECLPSYKKDLYLAHHGIKGQKWGVRRFQNPDGSYTSAGKARRGSTNSVSKKLTKSKVAKTMAVGVGVTAGLVASGVILSEVSRRQDTKRYVDKLLSNEAFSGLSKTELDSARKSITKSELASRRYSDAYKAKNARYKAKMGIISKLHPSKKVRETASVAKRLTKADPLKRTKPESLSANDYAYRYGKNYSKSDYDNAKIYDQWFPTQEYERFFNM